MLKHGQYYYDHISVLYPRYGVTAQVEVEVTKDVPSQFYWSGLYRKCSSTSSTISITLGKNVYYVYVYGVRTIVALGDYYTSFITDVDVDIVPLEPYSSVSTDIHTGERETPCGV